jgi:mRNA interferase HigB
MVVISYKTIREFSEKNPEAKIPLDYWYNITSEADWRSHADLKGTFPTADFVGAERYVFNIAGNNYRLIAAVNFKIRTVYIKFVGLHKDYDKVDAAKVNRF